MSFHQDGISFPANLQSILERWAEILGACFEDREVVKYGVDYLHQILLLRFQHFVEMFARPSASSAQLVMLEALRSAFVSNETKVDLTPTQLRERLLEMNPKAVWSDNEGWLLAKSALSELDLAASVWPINVVRELDEFVDILQRSFVMKNRSGFQRWCDQEMTDEARAWVEGFLSIVNANQRPLKPTEVVAVSPGMV